MSSHRTEVATLGGGCFWCTEAVFEQLKGVEKLESGYSGGKVPNPSYQQVCTGMTGHAEVSQITFDPDVLSFEDLLKVFFTVHDPTTLNRQGADVGTQYRSAIFFQSEKQKLAAEKSKVEAQKEYSNPIVTQIQPLSVFYKAEDYHQDYFDNNQNAPYCTMVIRPKLNKLHLK